MYYCKHCGHPYLSDDAVICVDCGAPRGKGENFCHNCGARLEPGDKVCMHCGVPTAVVNSDSKSKILAGLLGIFLGGWGIHNFYLGFTSKAIIQMLLSIFGYMLSCVGIGVAMVTAAKIWGIVEGVLILTGSISVDAYGVPLKQ